MVGIGDGVTVAVGDGVMLGDGVGLGVEVGPTKAACGSVQALKSVTNHNPIRIFLTIMPLLILVNDTAVNLVASSIRKGLKSIARDIIF